MTFVSVAEAARHLGIDVKTLRRWLADAQFPLQSHPCDGRKKGMSQEHLQVLARQHQRSLASLPEVPPVPVPTEVPPLPDTLLALPEQLFTLQTQVSALQQQIADLTLLLKPQAHPSERAAPTKSSKMSKHSSKPTPRSRPVSKPPRKPVHVIPRVEYDKEGQYVVICPKHGLLPFEPDTEAWFAWVAEQDAFRFVGKLGHFSAHHEWHIPKGAWRAHRQIRNQSYNVRLALSQELTITVLEQAAAALQAHLA
jgi:hypothetical protein